MTNAYEEKMESVEYNKERLAKDDFFRVPFDPRFPNMNQAKRCWVNYVDYHRCKKIKGNDYEPCYYFKQIFKNICPNSWVEKWNEQQEAGIFPYDFEKDLKAHNLAHGKGGVDEKDHGHGHGKH